MPDGPGYEVTEYDTSGDNIPDVRKLFKTVGEGTLSRLVLVCREADLNGDRRKDCLFDPHFRFLSHSIAVP